MPPTDHRLVRFFTERKTNVLYIAMPAYGVLLPALLYFLEIHSGYSTVANPAFAIFFTLAVLSREIAKIEPSVFFLIFLLAISSMAFWIPIAHYVAIPLLDRVFYPKRQGR